MSSPWKKQPEDVVDSVLKRAEVSKNSSLTCQMPPLYRLLVVCKTASPSPSSRPSMAGRT
ncbi:hypothetical protein RirG_031420 [Rhizophagus irregularis DAOM 197198w]|uniref:Uncharacterized protein n=1 Tax=Rhizophagus irregularis (strain DAOM 197198w) TaxID=1432141 RepID=A0A015KAL4_RHIIW|nr:hypothetical protein RirG_031420 [Rhizophagus irregularis DAOM 197198w]